MSFILCLETATRNCSVALAKDGKVVAEKSHCDAGYSHAEQLHPFILELLEEAQISIKQLEGIAVSSGPGSYTGLRIGVSAAKGLAYSLELPLIAIPTLQNIAQAAIQEDWVEEYGLIVPMIDARRMEVYTACFDGTGKQLGDTTASIIDQDSFMELLLENKLLFLGDGADKCEEVIQHSNAHFIKGFFPQAKYMAGIAHQKYLSGDFEDIAYFEPYYFKQFQAGKKGR